MGKNQVWDLGSRAVQNFCRYHRFLCDVSDTGTAPFLSPDCPGAKITLRIMSFRFRKRKKRKEPAEIFMTATENLLAYNELAYSVTFEYSGDYKMTN